LLAREAHGVLRFAQEALRHAGVLGRLLVQKLDRHALTKRHMGRGEDDAHGPDSENAFDTILACDDVPRPEG
jgi:hypothetical protein